MPEPSIYLADGGLLGPPYRARKIVLDLHSYQWHECGIDVALMTGIEQHERQEKEHGEPICVF